MSRRNQSWPVRSLRPSPRRAGPVPSVESLEERTLLSTAIPRDLDGDGLFTARDVGLLRQALIQRRFDAIRASFGNLPGLGAFAGRDWRLLRRPLGRNPAPQPIGLSAGLDSISDPDRDGQSSRANVTIVGRTFRFARVAADLNHDGFFETHARADAQGRFQISLVLPPGETVVRLRAMAPNGRRIETALRLSQAVDSDLIPPVVTILSPESGLLTGTGVTVVGRIVDEGSGVQSLLARVDAGPLTAIPFDPSTGAFQYVVALPLDGSADGGHIVGFTGVDRAGNTSTTVGLGFTLDATPPPAPTLELDPASDTAPLGDSQTTESVVTLVGHSEPGVTITLSPGGLTTQTDAAGQFRFTGVALALNANTFRATATDALGRSASTSSTFVRLSSTTPPVAEDGEVVLAWNQLALEAIRLGATYPPEASRALAISQAAVFDAVNAVQGARGYLVSIASPAGASLQAAVYSAAHRALTQLFPSQTALLDQAFQESRAKSPAGPSRNDGEATGRAVADAILAQRANDGWSAFVDYVPSSTVGKWSPAAPSFAPALLPQWGNVAPFVIQDPSVVLPPGPPDLTSAAYAADFAQVASLGSANSGARTADQTEAARFWADGGGTVTPPGHWNQIAQDLARSRSLTIAESARLFAMLGLAGADAGVICWQAKYTYEFWRPIAAVQDAELDGNPATTADSSWTPLLVTPPFPEYVSGHSTFSGAAAAILSEAFGDNTSFSSTSDGLPGVTRSFTSFSRAAEEAGMSRIYGGIHFEFSNRDGLEAGRKVAAAVLASFDATDNEPPRITVDSPAAGAVVADAPTISGFINDFGSGVQGLTIRIDGVSELQLAIDPTTGRFAVPLSFSTSGSEDGLHEVLLIGTDRAGNVSDPVSVRFTLDTRPPVLALDSPLAGDDLADAIGLIGSADPTGTYLTRLQYSFDDGIPRSVPFDPGSGEFNVVPDTSRLAIGDHVLKVEAMDAAGRVATTSVSIRISRIDTLSIAAMEPRDGAVDVGSTFRPRLLFSRPVDPATLTAGAVTATAAGRSLALKVVPSDDGASAWVYFNEPLPDAAQVTLTVDGSKVRGAVDGAALDGDGDGVPGGLLVSRFTTVSLAPLPGTSLEGVVADPGPDRLPGTFDDVRAGADGVLMTGDDVYLHPIAGAKVFILGRENEVVVTDAQGRFRFDSVPAGDVKLAIDGRTATAPPAGFFFPEMVMDLNVQVGRSNTVMGTMGERSEAEAAAAIQGVYLPRIASSILKPVSTTSVTRLEADAASAPGLTAEQRLQMNLVIAPGSLVGLDGSKMTGGQVGISTVPPELVREMLPPGVLQHSFDITIQAPGVSTFSTPAVLTIPNTFGAAPGTKLNLLSFDHTTGRLVLDGTLTVSADGLSATTDPGSGIVRPGWHGAATGTECEPCEEPGAGSGGGGNGPTFSLLAEEPDIEPKNPFGAKGLENKLFGHDGEKVKITLTNKLPKVNKKKEDGLIVVEVKADGPYARFLTGSAIGGLIGIHEFCPGEHSFEFKAKDLLDDLRKLAPSAQLDQLFGTTFKLTAYKKTDPGNLLARKSFTLGRFVGVTDPKTWESPKSSNFTAAFLKTLADEGGFVRTKQVEYDVGKDIAVMLELGGQDSGAYTLGTMSLKGKGTTNWKFDPSPKGQSPAANYSATIDMKVKNKDLGTVNAIGLGVIPTSLSPNATAIAGAFKNYLSNPFARNDLKPSEAFDAVYSVLYSNFGLGQSQEIKDEIEVAAADLGQKVFNSIVSDFGFLESEGALSLFPDDGDVSVVVVDVVRDGQNRARYGADPAADVDFGMLRKVLDNPQIPVAAREYAFTNALNTFLRGDAFRVSFNKHTNFTGPTGFANFLADTIAHEIGHTMGLLDSYDRGSLESVYEPKDMMIAGFPGRPNMHFDPSTNQMVMKAGTGVAPSKPGSLEQVMKTYRANGNFGILGAQNLDEELQARPGLSVETFDGAPFDGGGLDLGTVLADGPGGARAVQALVVTNVGSAPATISSVTFGAAGFSLADPTLVGTTLASGQSVTVEIVFDPGLEASRTVAGALTISYDDAPNLPFVLPLTATALTTTGRLALTLQTDPRDGLTPQNNLGGATVGGFPVFVSQFATLTNEGGGPLTITDIDVVKGEGQFVVSGLPAGFGPGQPVVLAPGESLGFDLQFRPDAPGLRPGQIRIVNDDPTRSETFQAVVGTGLPPSGTLYRPDGNYVAMVSMDRPNDPVFRSRTDARGHYRFVVPGGSSFEVVSFDPFSGLVAFGGGIASAAGVPTKVNRLLFVPSTAPDSDGDGLPDDIELAIGSSSRKTDTNSDGVGDFASIARGLDPIAGAGFPAGLVASLDLGGPAGALVVVAEPGDGGGRLVYVTAGNALVVVDLTRFDRPSLLSRLTLPGQTAGLAASADGRTLAVTTTSGLLIVDVANPANPAIVRTYTAAGALGRVVVLDDIAYAIAGNSVLALDLAAGGDLRQKLDLGGPALFDIAKEGRTLYAVDINGGFRVLDASGPLMTVRGSTALPSGRLFVGGGVAYVTSATDASGGFSTVDVSDPDAPTVLSLPRVPAFQTYPAEAIAVNSSGRAVAVGIAGSRSGLAVFDVADPRDTGTIVAQLFFPFSSRDIVLADGLAFILNIDRLLVVNILPFDEGNVPPTVSINTTVIDADPIRPGVQVPEGSAIPIVAKVSDDVQERFVELIVNGLVVATDPSFPYELNAFAPLLSSGRSTVTVQVRATDTGGNATLSQTLVFEAIADARGPKILGMVPTPGSTLSSNALSVGLTFDKPLAPSSVEAGAVVLVEAGADGNFNTGDDQVVPLRSVVLSPSGLRISAVPVNPIPTGRYRLTLDPARVRDRIGNALDGEFSGVFPSGDGIAGGAFVAEFRVGEGVTSRALPFDAFPGRLYPFVPDTTKFFPDFGPMVIADLNSDGLPDLARTFLDFSASDGVMILLGQPGEGYGTPVPFPTGPSPDKLVVVDLNGDGVLDIVTLNALGGFSVATTELSVLIGLGDGTFKAERRVTVVNESTAAGGLALGDFDRDGLTDVAVIVPGFTRPGLPAIQDRLVVLIGLGDGAFRAPTSTDLGTIGLDQGIAAGDLDGDGLLDIATNKHMLLGNGDGTFLASASNFAGTALAVADLDGDGLLDVVGLGRNFSESYVQSSKNAGGGIFAAPTYTSVPINSGDALAVGDLNGDGRPDVAISGQALAILINRGDGSFNAPILPPVLSKTAVAIADADGDGRPDVLSGAYGSVVVVRSRGDGTFELPLHDSTFEATSYARALGDVDGDGKVDSARIKNGKIEVWRGKGDGTWEAPTSSAPTTHTDKLFLREIDGDGKLDAIVFDRRANGVGDFEVWRGLGDGTFAPSPIAVSFSRADLVDAALVDLNGDGLSDFLVVTDFGDVLVRFNLGGGGVGPEIASNIDLGLIRGGLAFGDVNGDGLPDMATVVGSDVPRVALGRPGGTFEAASSLDGSFYGFGEAPVIADLDGDGFADLFSISGYNNQVIEFLAGNGDGTFKDPVEIPFARVNGRLIPLDINGDGLLDLLSTFGGEYIIAVGNGDGTFLAPAYFDAGNVIDLLFADLDGDGRLDLIGGRTILLRKRP